MSNHKSNHRALGIVWLLVVAAWCPAISFAHPMGNFSINHYAKLKVERGSIEVRYVIDMAEIPTFQEMRQFDIKAKADDPSGSRYLDREEQLLKQGLSLESDGQLIQLETFSRELVFSDGAGGLPTMKVGFVFGGKVKSIPGSHKLSYSDNNFSGRAGWKEIVVAGDGVTIIASSASSIDRSHELATYSSDVLNSPPQQLSAVMSYTTLSFEAVNRASGPPIALGKRSAHRALALQRPSKSVNVTTSPKRSGVQSSPNGIAASNIRPVLQAGQPQNTPRNRFTQLISTQSKLSFWVLLSAALIAASLGALHAMEPGHGKTIVAAYLVGSRGTAKHAVLLGIIVTAAHTAGVYLLGAATLYASRYIVPEQLYPWLGAISGLSVAGIGSFIFLRHWTGETAEHSHAPGERHSHWFVSMFKEPANRAALSATSKPSERALSLRELCMLGITGGIVPCPAALVVLLSAFSLHRVGFGLFLITAFSFGLAAVLVIVGLTMVYAKRVISSRVQAGNAVVRYLPFLSSGFMVVLGIGITVSAFASVQIWHSILSRDKLIPFVTVILLGLFLGMRHSTDPDHVVAVSTIVSRQNSIRSSATIGLLWGLGHTLTIFLVGSAIIIFGFVIPPRLGLSMEFCVALMLVLLGVLNLTGVMRWIAERTPPMKRRTANFQLVDGARSKPGGASRGIERLLDKTVGKLGLYETIRPLVVGLVHGLAGSAAVALLVLSTIKSPFWATAYLLVFGFGTMVGMMLMTGAISMPLVYAGKRFFKVNRYLIAVSGLASMAFGVFLVFQIAFVDGLFTSHAHWIPR